MFLYLIFLQYISIVLTNSSLLSDELKKLKSVEAKLPFADNELDDFSIRNPTCAEKRDTSLSPFVALVLFKSSGQFLGLGAILDKRTVLSSMEVVKKSLGHPEDLLLLAGSRSPWWGRYSQVIRATDIRYNDVGLVVILLKNSLKWTNNTKPIRIPPLPAPGKYEEAYGTIWGIFGIPRSSWDSPGDRVHKGAVYQLWADQVIEKIEHKGICRRTFPDIIFNGTVMQCTYANASYCWGTIGSPIIAIGDTDNVVLIGIVSKTTTTEPDEYHVFIKVTYFEQWISSFSAYSFIKKSKTGGP